MQFAAKCAVFQIRLDQTHIVFLCSFPFKLTCLVYLYNNVANRCRWNSKHLRPLSDPGLHCLPWLLGPQTGISRKSTHVSKHLQEHFISSKNFNIVFFFFFFFFFLNIHVTSCSLDKGFCYVRQVWYLFTPIYEAMEAGFPIFRIPGSI